MIKAWKNAENELGKRKCHQCLEQFKLRTCTGNICLRLAGAHERVLALLCSIRLECIVSGGHCLLMRTYTNTSDNVIHFNL